MLFHKTTLVFLFLLLERSQAAYTHETCCKKAKADGAFVGSNIPSFENQTCGQVYGELPPAVPLYIPFAYCAKNCGGMGLHKIDLPGSWAAPLVQFILPSIIFSMTIPRQHKIEFDYLFDWPKDRTGVVWVDSWLQLLVSMLLFVLILLPVIVDTILWMCTIVVGAGNMLIGGLYEAHLDYRIITYVQGLGEDNSEVTLQMKRELLVTIASGNLKLDKGDPQITIPNAIIMADPNDSKVSGHEKSRSRLLNLLGAQSSFGSAVGSPVLFYLGAFAYSILELFNDPSSEASSISLGFGIEWMIIVHVAIVSGCLLASNNPSTSSGIVGSTHLELKRHAATQLRLSTSSPSGVKRKIPWTWDRFKSLVLGWSNSYDTEFQPVSLWNRGSNKMRWVEKSTAYTREDNSFPKMIEITFWGWVFKVYIPCLLLIALPPATGGAVAYFTPPKGIACRSLSFIVYASCQVALVTFATIRAAIDHPHNHKEKPSAKRSKSILQKIFTDYGFIAISSLFWFGSLMSAVGGTVMQIIGVYNNCICYAGADSWWNVWRVHPYIQVATDTERGRHASVYWIWMGSVAAVFMALNCYVGWWYQRLVRHRFQMAVKAMLKGEGSGKVIVGQVVGGGAGGSEVGGGLMSPSVGGGSEIGDNEPLMGKLRIPSGGKEERERYSLDSDGKGKGKASDEDGAWQEQTDLALAGIGGGVGADSGIALQPVRGYNTGYVRVGSSSGTH